MVEDAKPEKSSGQWHGGKGSVQKPSDQDKYAENWDKIFGKKRKDKKDERIRVYTNLLWNRIWKC